MSHKQAKRIRKYMRLMQGDQPISRADLTAANREYDEVIHGFRTFTRRDGTKYKVPSIQLIAKGARRLYQRMKWKWNAKA